MTLPPKVAASNRRPALQSDGSDNWTRSRPLTRPCAPAAGGSIPFAAAATAQVSATLAAARAIPAAAA
jgi:hypothetical protein